MPVGGCVVKMPSNIWLTFQIKNVFLVSTSIQEFAGVKNINKSYILLMCKQNNFEGQSLKIWNIY